MAQMPRIGLRSAFPIHPRHPLIRFIRDSDVLPIHPRHPLIRLIRDSDVLPNP
jgi:hypothetical protein